MHSGKGSAYYIGSALTQHYNVCVLNLALFSVLCILVLFMRICHRENKKIYITIGIFKCDLLPTLSKFMVKVCDFQITFK